MSNPVLHLPLPQEDEEESAGGVLHLPIDDVVDPLMRPEVAGPRIAELLGADQYPSNSTLGRVPQFTDLFGPPDDPGETTIGPQQPRGYGSLRPGKTVTDPDYDPEVRSREMMRRFWSGETMGDDSGDVTLGSVVRALNPIAHASARRNIAAAKERLSYGTYDDWFAASLAHHDGDKFKAVNSLNLALYGHPLRLPANLSEEERERRLDGMLKYQLVEQERRDKKLVNTAGKLGADIAEHGASFWAGGWLGVSNLPHYGALMAIGPTGVVMESMVRTKERMSGDVYVDDFGNKTVMKDREGFFEAAAKGTAGAVGSYVIEKGVRGALKSVSPKAVVPYNKFAFKVRNQAFHALRMKNPAAAKMVYNTMKAYSVAQRAAEDKYAWYKAVNKVAAATGLHSLPEELLEELKEAWYNAALNLEPSLEKLPLRDRMMESTVQFWDNIGTMVMVLGVPTGLKASANYAAMYNANLKFDQRQTIITRQFGLSKEQAADVLNWEGDTLAKWRRLLQLYRQNREGWNEDPDAMLKARLKESNLDTSNVRIAEDEAGLPEHLVKQKRDQGADGPIEGVFDESTGETWLVKSNLSNDTVIPTLLHEQAAHRGLRSVLTDDGLTKVLGSVFEGRDRKEMEEIAERYGLDLNATKGQLGAAEEFLGSMAYDGKVDASLWQRTVAGVRSALRDIGVVSKFTDNDVRVLLRSAYRSVRADKAAPAEPGTTPEVSTGKIKVEPGNAEGRASIAKMTADEREAIIQKYAGLLPDKLPSGKKHPGINIRYLPDGIGGRYNLMTSGIEVAPRSHRDMFEMAVAHEVAHDQVTIQNRVAGALAPRDMDDEDRSIARINILDVDDIEDSPFETKQQLRDTAEMIKLLAAKPITTYMRDTARDATGRMFGFTDFAQEAIPDVWAIKQVGGRLERAARKINPEAMALADKIFDQTNMPGHPRVAAVDDTSGHYSIGTSKDTYRFMEQAFGGVPEVVQEFRDIMEQANGITERWGRWIKEKQPAGFKRRNIHNMRNYLEQHPDEAALFDKLAQRMGIEHPYDKDGKLRSTPIEDRLKTGGHLIMFDTIAKDEELGPVFVQPESLERRAVQATSANSEAVEQKKIDKVSELRAAAKSIKVTDRKSAKAKERAEARVVKAEQDLKEWQDKAEADRQSAEKEVRDYAARFGVTTRQVNARINSVSQNKKKLTKAKAKIKQARMELQSLNGKGNSDAVKAKRAAARKKKLEGENEIKRLQLKAMGALAHSTGVLPKVRKLIEARLDKELPERAAEIKAIDSYDKFEVAAGEALNVEEPSFPAFQRNFGQYLVDEMSMDQLEEVRKYYQEATRAAFNSGEVEEVDFLNIADPRPVVKDKDGKEKKLTGKELRAAVEKVFKYGDLARSALKSSEKTMAALNLNVACPMFFIGNTSCWIDACYLTAMAEANGTTYYKQAMYSGEFLQLPDWVISELNLTGGLRVNGVGDYTDTVAGQLRDAIIDARMRGENGGEVLQLKIITKQAATARFLQRLADEGIDISHVTVQPSMDFMWAPVAVDLDTPGSGVRAYVGMGSEQLNKLIDEDPSRADDFLKLVTDYYRGEAIDREVTVIDGKIMRKYGFSPLQVSEMQTQNPDVIIKPRWVVSTPEEVCRAVTMAPNSILTFMHGVIDKRVKTQHPGGDYINFHDNRHYIDWENNRVWGKSFNKKTPGEDVESYVRLNEYIDEHFKDPKEKRLLLERLEKAMCCQLNSDKDACHGCSSHCSVYRTLEDMRGNNPITKAVAEDEATYLGVNTEDARTDIDARPEVGTVAHFALGQQTTLQEVEEDIEAAGLENEGELEKLLAEDPPAARRFVAKLVGLIDVEGPWQLMGAPKTGFRLKNQFTAYAEGEVMAHDMVHDLNKMITNQDDDAEALFCASRPDRLNEIPPEQAQRIRPVVNMVRQILDEMGEKLIDWGALQEFWPQSEITRQWEEMDKLEKMLVRVRSGKWRPELPVGPSGKVRQKTLWQARQAKIAELEAGVAKIKEDIELLNQLKYVHLPFRAWMKNKMDTSPDGGRAMLSGMYKGIKFRKTRDPYSLVEEGVLKKEDVSIREAMAFYIRYVQTQRAQQLVKEAAIAEGIVKPIADAPADWASIDHRQFPVFAGYKMPFWVHDQMMLHFKHVGTPQHMLGRLMGSVKMLTFYNPIIMPMYDIFQMMMSTWGQGFYFGKRAAAAVMHKNDDYMEAWKHGAFPQPSMPSIKAFIRELENDMMGGWFDRKILSEIERLAPNDENPALWIPKAPKRVVEAIYRMSWSMAWSGDHIVRMSTYYSLKSRGFTPEIAAKLTAEVHGDYASVPQGTRKFLNYILYTPTFQLAMWKSYAKNVASVYGMAKHGIGAARGKEGSKELLAMNAQRFVTLIGQTAMLWAGHKLLKSMGWEADEWGRKYKRVVIDKNGERREVVMTFANPANLPLKYYHTYVARKPGMTYPEQVSRYGRYQLHPFYVLGMELTANQRPNGQMIVNPWDGPALQGIDGLRYTAGSVVRLFQDVIDEGDTSESEAVAYLREQTAGPLNHYMNWIAFGYVRDPQEIRVNRRAVNLVSSYVDAMIEKPPKTVAQAQRQANRVIEELDRLKEEILTIENKYYITKEYAKIKAWVNRYTSEIKTHPPGSIEYEENLRGFREQVGNMVNGLFRTGLKGQVYKGPLARDILPAGSREMAGLERYGQDQETGTENEKGEPSNRGSRTRPSGGRVLRLPLPPEAQ